MRKSEEHEPNPALLDEIDGWTDTLLYITEQQRTAIVLGNAVSHDPLASSTVPEFAVRGPSGTGKSTVLDVAVMLSDNGWVSDSTAPGIRAFFNTSGNHTLIIDEASKIFNEDGNGGKTHPIYPILTNGFRKRATLSYSVMRVLVNVSCYGVKWTAGIGESVPPDVLNRSVRIDMVPKPGYIEKADTLDDSVYATGLEYQTQLHEWMLLNHDFIADFNKTCVRKLHPKMNSRLRQVWGPLFAVAHAAGGNWPARIMDSFLTIGLDGGKVKPTINQQIVLDVAEIVHNNGDPHFLYTIDLIENLPERPLYEEWTQEYLVQALSRALGTTRQVKGERLNGDPWQGKGRDTAEIIKMAEEISLQLNPELEADEDDTIDDELGTPVI